MVSPARKFRAEFTKQVRSELSLEGGKNEIFIQVKIFTKEFMATKELFKMEEIGGVVKKLEN